MFASTESDEWAWPYLEIEYTGGAPAGPALELTGGLRTPLSTDRSALRRRRSTTTASRRWRIWLDPDLDPILDEAADRRRAAAVACPGELTVEFTLPAALSEGRHTMLVRSEDGDGRRHARPLELPRRRSLGQADRSRLGLEQWFQYDSTDRRRLEPPRERRHRQRGLALGADRRPGRGLSTVVNLTYNSQDHERPAGLGARAAADLRPRAERS